MALTFKIYKPGQAHTIRGIMAASVAFMLLFGCYELYLWLNFSDEEETPRLYRIFVEPFFQPAGLDLPVTGRLMLTLGLLVAGLFGIWYGSNHPRVGDFLVETEGEMKKVSWPSRNEVVASSSVVIATVVVLGLYILVVDVGLTWAQQYVEAFFHRSG